MRYFKNHVKRKLECEGWHVFIISDSEEQVDLVCLSNGLQTLVRARGSGHGHITAKVESELKIVGEQCGAHVLLAFVNSENEIVFRRVYP